MRTSRYVSLILLALMVWWFGAAVYGAEPKEEGRKAPRLPRHPRRQLHHRTGHLRQRRIVYVVADCIRSFGLYS